MKIKTRGRKYKYSNRQIRYFASMSKGRKMLKWVNKLYKQKKRQAITRGETGRVKYIDRAWKTAKLRIKRFGFKRQTWEVASSKDVFELAVSGKINEKQGKLLILDSEGNAIKIAYEGTEAFDEAIRTRQELFGTTNEKEIKTWWNLGE